MGDLRNTSNPPSSLRTIEPQLQQPRLQRQENTSSHDPNVKASFVIAALKDLEDVEDSPAVNSLRRVSRSFTQTPESNLRDLRHLSRTLTNKLNSVFAPKSGGSVVGVISENSKSPLIAGKRRVSTAHSIAYQEESQGLLDSEAMDPLPGGLNVPASITLRKASEALVPYAIPETNKTSYPDKVPRASTSLSQGQTPWKNLIAFRSKRVGTEALPTILDTAPLSKENLPSPQSDRSIKASPTESQGPLSSIDRRYTNRFSISVPDQKHTSTAKTVLTFADFYPSPGTFVKPNSRKNSISPDKAPFHISTMRILSSNSVHEIIWREDETPSSEESSGHVSLANKHSSHNSSSENDSIKENAQLPSDFIASSSPEEYHPLSRIHDSGSNEASLDPIKAHSRLFSWTWDIGKNQPKELEKIKPIHNRSRSTTVGSNSASIALRKTSLPAVQSFPVLSDRRSTPELHAEPLIDLDDTDSKREQSVPVNSDETSELDRGLAMFMKRSQKMAALSSKPSTPPAARMGKSGRTGSAVGSSSHVRVR